MTSAGHYTEGRYYPWIYHTDYRTELQDPNGALVEDIFTFIESR